MFISKRDFDRAVLRLLRMNAIIMELDIIVYNMFPIALSLSLSLSLSLFLFLFHAMQIQYSRFLFISQYIGGSVHNLNLFCPSFYYSMLKKMLDLISSISVILLNNFLNIKIFIIKKIFIEI